MSLAAPSKVPEKKDSDQQPSVFFETVRIALDFRC